MFEIPKKESEPEQLRGIDSKQDDWLLCAGCGEKIAKEEWKVDVDGSYVHNFVNPAGIEFRILTFSRQIGTLWHPESFAEHSWFSGFTWRIGQCGNCGSHLGWKFESVSGPDTFFGIIFDKTRHSRVR